MDDATERLISKVIDREGGYVNHPNDRGGPTNHGITQGTLAAWRKAPVSVADVQNLTELEARKIYRSNYFRGIDAVQDDASLEFLFDFSVNSGTGNAVKALQFVIGTTVDGAWGPNSAKALEKFGDQSKLYWPLVCYRFDFFMRDCLSNPKQAVFAVGWANRMREFWVGRK